MEGDKISIHNNIKNNLNTLKHLYKKRYSKEYPFLEKFLILYDNGEINKRHEVTESSQLRFIHNFGVLLKWLNIKEIVIDKKLSKETMSEFISDLKNNKIIKNNQGIYSEKTKNSIKLDVRTYFRWRLPEKSHNLVDWFDIREVRKTPNILTELEVEKLYKACKNNKERFLIVVLFDGGCRIEEFMNIRFEDIIEPTQDFPYYRIILKEEYSKTDGRTIGMYWKYSTETIRNFLQELDNSVPKKPIYENTYDGIRMFLTRLGKKVLKKRVHPHLFRKSSATYYANKLNRQELCIRYGWKFSSYMPDIYIKRSGMSETEIKDKILNTDLTKLEKENQELKTKFDILKNQIEENKKLEPMVLKKMEEIFEHLGDMNNRINLLSKKVKK